jgi:rod shape-determining protein MreC
MPLARLTTSTEILEDMNLFARHKNTVVLATVLLAQFLALAVQVKRQTAEGPVRVIRLLAVSALSPFERFLIYSGESARGVWANYIDLRNVRRENARLQAESEQMRLESAREQEDARQARRIQALLGFKEQWIDTTVAAQVIGTSGTESSRLLYIDKGVKDGIRADMPVITPDGVVGKVLAVYGDTAQVLMINDPTSGVGATLVTSRLQGIVKGTATGEVQLNYIMGDEAVQSGEALVTSGGDRVFPKGLHLGTVAKVTMGRNLFLDITLKPAVDLNRLEEVLVVTEQKPRTPDTAGLGPIRAADILAQHLPGVPQAQPSTAAQSPSQSAPNAQPASTANIPPHVTALKAPPITKPQAVAPAGTNAVKQTAKPAGSIPPHVTALKAPPTTKPQAVAPSGTNVVRQTAKPAGSIPPHGTAQGTAQKPPPAKPQTVALTGTNATKQSNKPSGTSSGAATAGQKPSVPKSVTPKPVSPHVDKPKPKSPDVDKPKPVANEGTHPQ